ncbi:YciK family oxidoreductase [Saccharospirillum impatiens]|uniref:YciK family oxidoreductase n=1 Tax=Saccharospirillum impatiens TaxID=169438 RepID=UPI00041B331C|nr:YciK family oxidoreductase [Saccharospirillum impatiens]
MTQPESSTLLSRTDLTLDHLQQAQTNDALSGQVIVVTGAGDGIGKAAALDFASAGAHVVLIGRTQDKLEAVYDQIEATTQTEPIILPLDLNDLTTESAQELAHGIEQTYGRLDGVLLNASLLGDKMSITQYPPKVWSTVMNVNLNSAFHLTQALLPLLEVSPAGRIIYTTSSVGREGRAYWGAYAVSKFATEGLMQTLADELKNISRVRVHCINPGGTRTAMRAKAYPGEDPKTVPAPESHMPLYRYLLSPLSQDFHGISWDARDCLSQ